MSIEKAKEGDWIWFTEFGINHPFKIMNREKFRSSYGPSYTKWRFLLADSEELVDAKVKGLKELKCNFILFVNRSFENYSNTPTFTESFFYKERFVVVNDTNVLSRITVLKTAESQLLNQSVNEQFKKFQSSPASGKAKTESDDSKSGDVKDVQKKC